MTIDERFDRLEHYTAGPGEQFLREREENRALWRECSRQIEIIDRNLARLSENFVRFQEEAAERNRQIDERFREAASETRETERRIQGLVSAIGEFMRKDKG